MRSVGQERVCPLRPGLGGEALTGSGYTEIPVEHAPGSLDHAEPVTRKQPLHDLHRGFGAPFPETGGKQQPRHMDTEGRTRGQYRDHRRPAGAEAAASRLAVRWPPTCLRVHADCSEE